MRKRSPFWPRVFKAARDRRYLQAATIRKDCIRFPAVVSVQVSTKVGVAVFPDDGTDIETLQKNAEAALKQSKASGSRYLFHAQKMTDVEGVKLTLDSAEQAYVEG